MLDVLHPIISSGFLGSWKVVPKKKKKKAFDLYTLIGIDMTKCHSNQYSLVQIKHVIQSWRQSLRKKKIVIIESNCYN